MQYHNELLCLYSRFVYITLDAQDMFILIYSLIYLTYVLLSNKSG
jgi:hypothetical protein